MEQGTTIGWDIAKQGVPSGGPRQRCTGPGANQLDCLASHELTLNFACAFIASHFNIVPKCGNSVTSINQPGALL